MIVGKLLFWFKIFSSMILWARVSFLVKSTLHLAWILWRNSNFLRMVLIYLSILGKMTIGFRSISVVNSEENDNLF